MPPLPFPVDISLSAFVTDRFWGNCTHPGETPRCRCSKTLSRLNLQIFPPTPKRHGWKARQDFLPQDATGSSADILGVYLLHYAGANFRDVKVWLHRERKLENKQTKKAG